MSIAQGCHASSDGRYVKAVSKFIHSNWAAARNKSPYLAERMNFCINLHHNYCRIG
jgi:hypothetical protein